MCTKPQSGGGIPPTLRLPRVDGVMIRALDPSDWPRIHPFFSAIVAAGDSYSSPDDLTEEAALAAWTALGHTVVAVDDAGVVLGTATMGPNRPNRGSHVATGSFMVDPAHAGRGVGRALGGYLIRWATDAGFRAIQFNAVVETNTAAVALWTSLGFRILTTVPEAYDHRELGLVGLHIMHLALPVPT